MAIKQRANVIGMSDDGDLEIEFEDYDDGKPAPTPEERKKAVERFSGGDVETAEKRYKAVQGWATQVHQRNLALEQRLSKLEEVTQASEAPRAVPKLPVAADPGTPNMDAVLSDPAELRKFVMNTVHSQFAHVGDFVQQQLEPFRPVLSAYKTHNELQGVVSKYSDFAQWQPEMLEISKSLPDDSNMSLEQIYLKARADNPEKAQKIEMGEYNPTAPQGKTDTLSSEGAEGQATDTASGVPTDTQTNSPEAPSSGDATMEELQNMAARHNTETGVATGAEPQTATASIQSALDAAWEDVTRAKA